MKKKSQEVDLIYFNKEKNKRTSNAYPKGSSAQLKSKKSKKMKNENIDLDKEIIIGLTKKNNKNVKKKANTIKSGKTIKNEVTKNKNKKVKPNKKKKELSAKTKFLLKATKWLVIAILLIASIVIFMLSATFNIKNIEVINNQKISKEEIISLSSIVEDTNIFKINKKHSITNIKENAYINKVKITRKLPNKIILDIEERTVTYMLEFANGYVYINNQGYMLEISNEAKEVPIIVGYLTEIEDMDPGNRLIVKDLERLETVLKIMETAKINEISDYISKIDISNNKNYTLILEQEGKIAYLGDASNINERIMYLKEIISKESGIKGEAFINGDLNTERVYFKQEI